MHLLGHYSKHLPLRCLMASAKSLFETSHQQGISIIWRNRGYIVMRRKGNDYFWATALVSSNLNSDSSTGITEVII